ncbi:MAG: hypothetical protein HC869_24565 [Rhodospirillales bacterium]|nr:hypothetical protein [Rhodospirillales bacterium]
MRRTFALVALALPLCLQPALALDRFPPPQSDASTVLPVADLDRPMHTDTYRRHRADAFFYWRYRAAYTRWMHNEYVRAGYPVRHRQFRTYARTYACCRTYRHW